MTDNMVFHPERGVYNEHVNPSGINDESKPNSNDDLNNDDHFWPPSPKRPRIDEDSLLAEAVVEYAANVGDANAAPTMYQQAM
ncbi:polyprotein [Phytophthora palmivora]|uniref:Polyprotein n=1 Tax=Phytophthora palmivora TaxID=4796 RepID=A0A2P4X5D5_9STRA|nr:polyprotein [Phytophthora palmivora]